MRSGIALLSCLFVVIAFGEDKKPETVTLTGKVVSTGGKPVAGASVEFRSDLVGRDKPDIGVQDMDDLLATTTTDEKGEFAFRNVAVPRVAQNVHRNVGLGYMLARATGHGASLKMVVAPGEQAIAI